MSLKELKGYLFKTGSKKRSLLRHPELDLGSQAMNFSSFLKHNPILTPFDYLIYIDI